MSNDSPFKPHLEWYEWKEVNSSPTGLVCVSVSCTSCTLGKIFRHTWTSRGQNYDNFYEGSETHGSAIVHWWGTMAVREYPFKTMFFLYFFILWLAMAPSSVIKCLYQTYPVFKVAYLNVYRFVDDFSFCFLLCQVKIAFVSLYVSFIFYFVFA